MLSNDGGQHGSQTAPVVEGVVNAVDHGCLLDAMKNTTDSG